MVAYGATLRGLAGASQVSVKAIRSYGLESVAPPDTDSRPGAWGLYSTPGAPRWVIRQVNITCHAHRMACNVY